jgi:hypothetical protein
MNFDIANLLPDDVSVYSGFGFVRVVVPIVLALVVVRSCIHVFAQDGGAQRIAGVDTSVAGGDNVIAMFHQWGAVQLPWSDCSSSCSCAIRDSRLSSSSRLRSIPSRERSLLA